jgi:hypothetical protein
VQRGFPPSMRSIVMVSGALAEGLGGDLAGRHDGEIGVPGQVRATWSPFSSGRTRLARLAINGSLFHY